METNLTVQVCNTCESTDLHFYDSLNTFICNTCGQHMTDTQTAIKYLDSGTKKLLQAFTLFFLLLVCLPGKSQFISFKDTAVNMPAIHFSIPVVNNSVVTMQADTLQLDSGVIKYIKVKGGAANSLTKLLNPVSINPIINMLQRTIDSLKLMFAGQVAYYYDINNVPVGNGTAYRLPANPVCIVDTGLIQALKSVDSGLYYLDPKSQILKAKPAPTTTLTSSTAFTAIDVKKK